MNARKTIRQRFADVFGLAVAIPATYAFAWVGRRAEAEAIAEAFRERAEMLAWAADKPCEHYEHCCPPDPEYMCWPCNARDRLGRPPARKSEDL